MVRFSEPAVKGHAYADGPGASVKDAQVADLEELMRRVAEGMEARGWTNVDLSRAIGAPLSVLSRWFPQDETPRSYPAAKYLLLLPKALNVEDRWLFSFDGPRERRQGAGDLQAQRFVSDLEEFAADMRARYTSTRPDGVISPEDAERLAAGDEVLRLAEEALQEPRTTDLLSTVREERGTKKRSRG